MGGVIIDLDSKSVIDQFRRYSNKTERDIIRLISQSQDLIDYEIGKMSDSDFCQAVNKLLHTEFSQASFENIGILFG